MDYCFTQDLGKVGDYHGLVLTRTVMKVRSRTEYTSRWEEDAESEVVFPEITVIGLERNQWDYAKLVDDTRKRLGDPRIVGNCFHVVDATGVGLPTIDFMMRDGLSPIGIWITSGSHANPADYGYTVPKVDLINSLQLALSSGMIKFAKGLPQEHVNQLLHEFKTFKEKKTAKGNTTFDSWRESDHDDLVLSLAMNVWWVFKIHGISLIRKRRHLQTQDDYDPIKAWL